MDWLYHELDPPAQASFREHLETCETCAADVASFSFLRELTRALPRVEPPVACSNIILHEANKRGAGAHSADGAASSGIWGFIERLLRPVIAHPAAAAMASLMLIVTIGGTVYLRGRGETSEPVLVNEQAALPRMPELSATGMAERPAPDEADPMSGDRGLADDRIGRAADLIDTEKQDELHQATTSKQPKKYRADADEDTRKEGAGAEPAKRKGSTTRANTKSVAMKPADKGVALDSSNGAFGVLDAPGKAPAATPPAPPVTSQMAQGMAQESKGDARSTPAGSALDAKYQELQRALASRRCTDAARIANDILDQDRGYYERNVRDHASACSRQIMAETSARLERRAAEARRAKKAEQADEAAAEAEAAE